MNVDLIDRAAAEGQARQEVIDRLLVTAEKEAGKGLWMLREFPASVRDCCPSLLIGCAKDQEALRYGTGSGALW
jgi:hypothetical protein